MSDLLFRTNPLARPAAPTVAAPKQAKPELGGSVSASSFHHEWNFPPPPKTVYENDYIRFKIQLEAKWEAVAERKAQASGTADFKVSHTDPKLNVQVGTKAWLTETIEFSSKVKISPNSREGWDAAGRDPKTFGLSLLRYLEVVLGKAFKIDSRYVKFIGAGLVWDADYCFFSVLVPVTIPVATNSGVHDPKSQINSAKTQISTQAVIKFGPGNKFFEWAAKVPGARRAATGMLSAVQRLAQKLPSVLAKEATAAAEKAALEAGELATEGVLAPTVAGSAAWEAFCTWAGVAMLAVPIAVTVAEWTGDHCRAMAASGAMFGDLNLYAQTYMRRVYGLRGVAGPGVPHGNAVIRTAIAQADEDLLEHGQFYLRRYLENSWNGGRAAFGQRQVDVMAERFWLFLDRRFNPKPSPVRELTSAFGQAGAFMIDTIPASAPVRALGRAGTFVVDKFRR